MLHWVCSLSPPCNHQGGAKELRVKESDRIETTLYNLKQLGAEVEEFEDGMKVYPMTKINDKAKLKSFGDHRIAMIALCWLKDSAAA